MTELGAVQRAARLPLRLIPRSTTLRILGGPLRGTRWIAGSSTHGSWIGTYEREKLALFAAAISPGDVIYDLGAHVGLYSLLGAQRVGHSGRAYAFEPLPRNIAYLRRHLSMNDVTNCTVLNVAVGSTTGTAVFDESVHPAMGHLGSGGGHVITVRTAVLDELLAERVILPPNVIKCDIEGAEHDCLLGAETILTTFRPIVFLATHGSEVHMSCCRLLAGWGYDLFSLDRLPLHDTTEVLALPRI